MTSYEFGDVILVPSPFTDQSTSKQRPAAVISSPAYNREWPDIIIMALTSRVRDSAGLGEMLIRDWRNAGLIKPTMVKPVLATLDQALVRKILGRLTLTDIAGLRGAVQQVIG